MGDYLTQLFSLLPAAWQPYVVLFLIVAYVVTKWRSNNKTNLLSAAKAPKAEIGMFGKIVDFLF